MRQLLGLETGGPHETLTIGVIVIILRVLLELVLFILDLMSRTVLNNVVTCTKRAESKRLEGIEIVLCFRVQMPRIDRRVFLTSPFKLYQTTMAYSLLVSDWFL